MNAYEKWEKEQDISPVSPEAYYAEKAWNAALKAFREGVEVDADIESNVVYQDVMQTLRTDK